MMTTLQKWLLGLVGLGAGYLILTHPQGAYQAGQAITKVVGGSETEIITGGQRGG